MPQIHCRILPASGSVQSFAATRLDVHFSMRVGRRDARPTRCTRRPLRQQIEGLNVELEVDLGLSPDDERRHDLTRGPVDHEDLLDVVVIDCGNSPSRKNNVSASHRGQDYLHLPDPTHGPQSTIGPQTSPEGSR